MKKIVTILLCCIMILGLVACNSSDAKPSDSAKPADSAAPPADSAKPADSAAPVTRDVVYIGTDSDCGSLDPYVISGSGFLPVMSCYAQPMWYYDGLAEGFASEYVLAESIDTISDTEYVIHLRKGVTFSNGSEFTASDVIFTLNYVKNESARAYYIASVDVDKCVAEDDYTVRFFLSYYDKTMMPSMFNITMLDEQTFDAKTVGMNPIGTGPYVVTDYVVNSSVTLELRDDYWGEAPAIKKLVFKNIPEASQKVNAIQTGEVDMLVTCPNSDVEYVDSLDGIRTISRTSVSQVMLTFNACKDSPLATKEARWAIAYATNREGILDVALNGNGSVATTPYSSGCSDYSDKVANLHDTYKTGYNLELAKKYAEESGLVGKTVRLVTNGTDVYVTTAQIIEQALKEIGVNAQVVNLDQATVRNLIAGEVDWEVYVSWTSAGSAVGADIAYAQISKFNRSHFDHDTELFAKYDSMGKELLATSDMAKYNSLLLDYLTMYEEDCFMYGIADMNTISAAIDSLQGLATEGTAIEHPATWYFAS